MKPERTKEFYVAMQHLRELFPEGKADLNNRVLTAYFNALRMFTWPEVLRGVEVVMKTRTYPTFPAAAEIVDACREPAADAARLAFDHIINSGGISGLKDTLAMEIYQGMRKQFVGSKEKDIFFLRRDFVQRYQSALDYRRRKLIPIDDGKHAIPYHQLPKRERDRVDAEQPKAQPAYYKRVLKQMHKWPEQYPPFKGEEKVAFMFSARELKKRLAKVAKRME
jgi:hypothetical protein